MVTEPSYSGELAETKGVTLDLPAQEPLYEAKLKRIKQETKAYKAERRYHQAQTDRLLSAAIEEEASLAGQRIYDFTGDVRYGEVRQAINVLTEWVGRDPDTPIMFRILTFGGDLLASLAMYDYLVLLNQQGTKVDTMALGVCASGGMVVLQGGQERFATPNAWLMIHEVSGIASGKLSEIVDESKWTKRAQEKMLTILADRSNMSTTQIRNRWKRKDWWLEAGEAKKHGFIDSITGPVL